MRITRWVKELSHIALLHRRKTIKNRYSASMKLTIKERTDEIKSISSLMTFKNHYVSVKIGNSSNISSVCHEGIIIGINCYTRKKCGLSELSVD